MKINLLLSCVIICFTASSQTYTVRVGDSELPTNRLDADFNKAISKFSIKKDEADNPAKTFKVQIGDFTREFKTDGAFHDVEFSPDIKDIRDKSIAILNNEGNIEGTTFKLRKGRDDQAVADNDKDKGLAPTIILPKESAAQFAANYFGKNVIYNVEHVGLKLRASAKNTENKGSEYVHLFFDQMGNSLIRSIPIGIAQAKYVVHIFYLTLKDNPLKIDYKINQSPADVEEGVVIRGEQLSADILKLQALDRSIKTVEAVWNHYELALTPSSNDIQLEIIRSSFALNENGELQVPEPVVVATRMIKIKKVYNGSIDVGILKSNLANPTFTLSPSDVDPNQMVVKRSDAGDRVLASVMYTFYASPIVILEKLLHVRTVESYKLLGRNFVDDHKFYERIYPTFGVGLSDRILENIFLGGKWEFAKGGSLFVGYHKGKVNILNVDKNFEFSKTFMTQEEFNLKTDRVWKGSFCIGLNLDTRIVTRLFQRTGNEE